MTKIFLDYDQQGLDRAYDQRAWAANMEHVLAEYATASEQVRQRLGKPAIYSYGPTPIERVEVFPTSAPLAPVLIFIHGGAWRRGTATDYSFLAEMFVGAGSLCRRGFCSGNRGRWRFARCCISSNACDRLGRSQRRTFGRRSRPDFSCRPLFRGPFGGCGCDGRLDSARSREGYLERRFAHQRHIRFAAGTDVRAKFLRAPG